MHGSASCTVTKDGDAVRIAPECANVALNPTESKDHILQTVVSRNHVITRAEEA